MVINTEKGANDIMIVPKVLMTHLHVYAQQFLLQIHIKIKEKPTHHRVASLHHLSCQMNHSAHKNSRQHHLYLALMHGFHLWEQALACSWKEKHTHRLSDWTV